MPDQKDHSLYVGIYSVDEQEVKFKGKIQPQELPIKIKFNEKNRQKEKFIPNKISFHQSGYTHVTDKNGRRLGDGTVSIPFEKIDKFTKLAVIVLRNPETFPEATEVELSDPWSGVINFDSSPNKPYQLHLFLTNKKIDISRIPREIGYFACLETEGQGLEYDLIWFFCEPNGIKNWGSYNLILTFSQL